MGEKNGDPRVEVVAELLHSLYCGKRQVPHSSEQADGLDEDNAKLILAALDYESV